MSDNMDGDLFEDDEEDDIWDEDWDDEDDDDGSDYFYELYRGDLDDEETSC